MRAKGKSFLVCFLTMVLTTLAGVALTAELSDNEQLGKAIFFDEDLSLNRNQSCASCHGPEVGWTGPDSFINDQGSVYEGSVPGRFGNRKPPTAAYATLSPIFYMDKKGLFVGGNFWDGRATGQILGNPAADQAMGPFLNPVEQALPDSACVVYRVCNASYPVSFEDVWGDESCNIQWPMNIETQCATEGISVSLSPSDREKSDMAYGNIALSIAAYEASAEVNAFSSKYDLTFNSSPNKAKLSKEEQKGLALFWGKGKCARCHSLGGKEALF
ncbi:MAG: cytochrome c peroxidase, partial [Desulfobacteraceae bacterium]|nr:cytochrome c peroxidase [Desulfobacteraceae bacterium]